MGEEERDSDPSPGGETITPEELPDDASDPPALPPGGSGGYCVRPDIMGRKRP